MAQGDGEEVAAVQRIENLANSIRELHDAIIRTTGGVLGEKSASLLSAVARPFYVVDNKFVYPTYLEMAAAMFHGLICGHVFADGSKRTGTMIAAAIIELDEELGHTATPEEIKRMEVIALQAALPGGMPVQEIIDRFREIFPPVGRTDNDGEEDIVP